jgi:hypothetical protein
MPPGEDFEKSIARAVNKSNLFIFLISPESVAQGRYTLTELTLARQKWPSPSGHVLPVKVRTTSRDQIPSYLRAVTILEPHGNVAAETSVTVDQIGRLRNRAAVAGQTWSFAAPISTIGVGLGAALIAWVLWHAYGSWPLVTLVSAALAVLGVLAMASLSNNYRPRSRQRRAGWWGAGPSGPWGSSARRTRFDLERERIRKQTERDIRDAASAPIQWTLGLQAT